MIDPFGPAPLAVYFDFVANLRKFSGAGTLGAFTVQSSRASINGKMVTVALYIDGINVTGGVVNLSFDLPIAAKYTSLQLMWINANAVQGPGRLEITAGQIIASIGASASGASFPISAGGNGFCLCFTYEAL